ncbi:MAG: acylphosphatase [Gammaproteobacteria bacterium]|jgi:acylphosphatase
MICRRCLVSGRVQGVFFRASTRTTALALGLSGHARNLADGRVEVVVCGPDDAVARLQDWLHEGPSGARVTAVDCSACAGPASTTFQIS